MSEPKPKPDGLVFACSVFEVRDAFTGELVYRETEVPGKKTVWKKPDGGKGCE